MTFPEATELAVYAKELFPRSTDAQAAVVRDLVAPFPDGKYVRELLKRLATETTILPTPLIRNELAMELRRRGQTAEDYARQQDRLQESGAVRCREEIERVIADFGDEDLEEMKPQALERLRLAPWKLTDDALAFVAKRHPRKSFLLRSAIYALVKPQAQA